MLKEGLFRWLRRETVGLPEGGTECNDRHLRGRDAVAPAR